MELTLVELANRLIEIFQNGQTRRADTGFNDAAVIRLASAREEAALFHAVEEARHVRVMRNHALADGATSEALGLGAAKNAEDIVLRTGKTVGLEKLLRFEAKGVSGLLEGNEDAVLDG